MIEAVIFDLDGTLVKTERLKAISYARAAMQLRPREITEEVIVEAFKDVVGLPRREVAMNLVDRFDLGPPAAERRETYGVAEPWQAYVQLRLEIYDEMLADPEVLLKNQWPHNVELLEMVRIQGCRIGLATMSRCRQASRVLEILELRPLFDFVATRDDVNNGKPDPEIYQLVASELRVDPGLTLVVEDSPSGVRAAINAEMNVVAVSTPFTRTQLHQSNLLPEERIVDHPGDLLEVVHSIFVEFETSQPASSS